MLAFATPGPEPSDRVQCFPTRKRTVRKPLILADDVGCNVCFRAAGEGGSMTGMGAKWIFV